MSGIFFDLDGVLIRSRHRDRTFLWSEKIEGDLMIERALREQAFRQPEWGEILCGRLDFVAHLEKVFRAHEVSTSVREFVEYWLQNDLNWYRDVLELLIQLKGEGNQLFIASNQDRLRSQFIRAQKEVSGIFSDIFTSSDLGVTKPATAFFHKLKQAAADQLDGIPLMIDDASSNLSSAREAGFKTIHFDPDLDPQHSADWLRSQINMLVA